MNFNTNIFLQAPSKVIPDTQEVDQSHRTGFLSEISNWSMQKQWNNWIQIRNLTLFRLSTTFEEVPGKNHRWIRKCCFCSYHGVKVDLHSVCYSVCLTDSYNSCSELRTSCTNGTHLFCILIVILQKDWWMMKQDSENNSRKIFFSVKKERKCNMFSTQNRKLGGDSGKYFCQKVGPMRFRSWKLK